VCEGSSGGGDYGDTMSFSGLIVWDVTVSAGFDEVGRVSFDGDTGCQNWWTQPGSRVKRSIIMDDYVFSISDSLLKVNHLGSLGLDVVVLQLPSE
jgi:hypothetical protein